MAAFGPATGVADSGGVAGSGVVAANAGVAPHSASSAGSRAAPLTSRWARNVAERDRTCGWDATRGPSPGLLPSGANLDKTCAAPAPAAR